MRHAELDSASLYIMRLGVRHFFPKFSQALDWLKSVYFALSGLGFISCANQALCAWLIDIAPSELAQKIA